MNTTLTPQQIEAYQRDGFLAIESFLTPAELAELRAAVDEAVASMGSRKVSVGLDEMKDADDYYDRVFKQRLNLWRINETVKRTMLHPALGGMLCDLAGVDGMRVWHDQALIKPPFGNPTGWHLDNPYWSFSSRRSISIWIALDAATFQNGCMYYVPGSQLLADYRNVPISEDIGALFRVYPEFLARGTVGVELPPGGCALHNGLTAHGAGANMTTGQRRAMTCAYMPDGSTFNGTSNILPQSYLRTLKVGDVLDNEALNPLIYARPGSRSALGKP
jgi:ectoine hydroxylase-related dioxygenase (phytanoyl-CoA dioxygenase family)